MDNIIKWTSWNPWHGCTKLSPGCANCYVYRSDARYEKDSSVVSKTKNFNLPIQKKRNGDYKVPSGSSVAACFTSDFFLNTADDWRAEAWQMIKIRQDLQFLIITKRIDRFHVTLPADWGDGYPNVTIGCTVENQSMADYRLPIYMDAPINRKLIICEPLLERIDLSPYVNSSISQIVVGGESGNEARVCDYSWVLDIRELCVQNKISFWFKQTGANFLKSGKRYRIKRNLQHSQARKSGISVNFKSDK